MAFKGVQLLTMSISPTIGDMEGRFASFEADDGRLLEIRREEMRDIGQLGVAILQQEAPKRTGWFASRIRYHLGVVGVNSEGAGMIRRGIHRIRYLTGFVGGNALELRFTWPQPLGTWITGGTGIYGPRKAVIRPVRKKALRFEIGGKVIFAAWVRGMKPNPFVDRAMTKIRPMAMDALRRMGNKVTSELAGK